MMRGYYLTRPCAKCPFRTDREPYLRGERAEEIVDSLRSGAEFPCHETLDYSAEEVDEYGAGEPARTDKTTFCAGALIMLENSDGPNQIMRISERLGLYDHTKLDKNAPVYDEPESFIDACYDQGG